ncbi:hypothetical protein [Lunatibacter salilacus]|uniref:hypothetical protein n=1 Tax=Lunatibacter salilacus TaxID=2483804 RepID=UPI00131E8651|nr:hypothetical protein [Lunatibacter salilacus]
MKHKVYLSLTDEDLEKLKAVVESGESDDLNKLIKLLTDKEDKNKYIEHHVYLALSDISGFEPEKFNNDSDLKYDLGLSLYHKRALKNYFQKIIAELDSDKTITVSECEKLKKVNDCLKLVKSKI